MVTLISYKIICLFIKSLQESLSTLTAYDLPTETDNY